jgi:hypothetical protein
MHLRHAPLLRKQRGFHVDFAIQIIEVARGLGAVPGGNLVARAVKTQGAAKRQMHIQRQPAAHRAGVALRGRCNVIGGAEAVDKSIRGRVRGVTRAVAIEPLDQIRIELAGQVLRHSVTRHVSMLPALCLSRQVLHRWQKAG